ncbi:MAG: NAD(P)(+) transhydrogenase (Re/Si-specific) subunit alpha, partial [Gemmatimonadaceae bacterium]
MRLAVPNETAPGELRVALTPDTVGRLVKGGHDVRIQAGAGERAGFPDSAYVASGATVVERGALYGDVALVCRVQPPSPAEADEIPEGAALLALMNPSRNAPLLAQLAKRNVTALALELVPRITRAQSMDVLSSQST